LEDRSKTPPPGSLYQALRSSGCSDFCGEAGENVKTQEHTVALVDDDPNFRKALSRLLSERGYRVEPFASAAEFFRVAPSTKAACLIVDIRLGETSGLELARHLAADGFELPVIFLSSCEDDVVRMRCHELNCAAYLQKPCPEARLIEAIAAAIGSKAKRG
jgi:FixJ family two-component response regulator